MTPKTRSTRSPWTTLGWTLACAWLLAAVPDPARAAGGPCGPCHPLTVEGAHAAVACAACHGDAGELTRDPGRAAAGGRGCVTCHAGYGGIFDQPMTTRAAERAALHGAGPGWFEAQCGSCHVAGCLDCHGPDGHAIARPDAETCARCHRGYFVGADYFGRAPREDSLRYQRGPTTAQGEHYLQMAPDLHREAGMTCGACHSMASLASGRPASRTCRDCHDPDPAVPEHGIPGHLTALECVACHAGWAAQEYGTFLLHISGTPTKEYFRLRGAAAGDDFSSAYLRKQDLPPLGIDRAGRVAPIRPQFILYTTEVRGGRVVGRENRLLGADWKVFAPHTVRRGGPLCEACHDNPRRYLLEDDADRIYEIDRDGLGLRSFWSQTGQRVTNGAFMSRERYQRGVAARGEAYVGAYLERWGQLLDTLAPPAAAGRP